MNQSELVAAIARRADLSQRRAGIMVNHVLAELVDTLARGEKVTLSGFGTFEVRLAPPRVGRHPSTGAALSIPSRRVVGFRAGVQLTDAVAASLETDLRIRNEPRPAKRAAGGPRTDSLQE